MRKYIGEGAFVPGVPARDLTEGEYQEHVDAGRIVEGEPSATLWEKQGERRTPRAKADSGEEAE